jgi:hypothetical protein
MKKVDGLFGSCEKSCACERCTFEYARCADDVGCQFINACAEQEGCRGVDACRPTNCGGVFPISGGINSLGAQLFDDYSTCMVLARCGCSLD